MKQKHWGSLGVYLFYLWTCQTWGARCLKPFTGSRADVWLAPCEVEVQTDSDCVGHTDITHHHKCRVRAKKTRTDAFAIFTSFKTDSRYVQATGSFCSPLVLHLIWSENLLTLNHVKPISAAHKCLLHGLKRTEAHLILAQKTLSQVVHRRVNLQVCWLFTAGIRGRRSCVRRRLTMLHKLMCKHSNSKWSMFCVMQLGPQKDDMLENISVCHRQRDSNQTTNLTHRRALVYHTALSSNV